MHDSYICTFLMMYLCFVVLFDQMCRHTQSDQTMVLHLLEIERYQTDLRVMN